jgi:hypothetical protein
MIGLAGFERKQSEQRIKTKWVYKDCRHFEDLHVDRKKAEQSSYLISIASL